MSLMYTRKTIPFSKYIQANNVASQKLTDASIQEEELLALQDIWHMPQHYQSYSTDRYKKVR